MNDDGPASALSTASTVPRQKRHQWLPAAKAEHGKFANQFVDAILDPGRRSLLANGRAPDLWFGHGRGREHFAVGIHQPVFGLTLLFLRL